MNFKPETEQEIREDMLLPDGEYDFEVVKAAEGQSKNGSDMITLTLEVYRTDGSSVELRDWLVGAEAPMCRMKILHFANATGLMELYHQGALGQHACEGVAGRVKIGSEESPGYGPQNKVIDYIPPGTPSDPPPGVPANKTKAANKKANADFDEAAQVGVTTDDELPF